MPKLANMRVIIWNSPMWPSSTSGSKFDTDAELAEAEELDPEVPVSCTGVLSSSPSSSAPPMPTIIVVKSKPDDRI